MRAVTWDAQFSPLDGRTLAGRHRAMAGGRMIFDRQIDGRAERGRAAIGTRREVRLVSADLAAPGAERLPDAVLFRTRSGKACRCQVVARLRDGARACVSTKQATPLRRALASLPCW